MISYGKPEPQIIIRTEGRDICRNSGPVGNSSLFPLAGLVVGMHIDGSYFRSAC